MQKDIPNKNHHSNPDREIARLKQQLNEQMHQNALLKEELGHNRKEAAVSFQETKLQLSTLIDNLHGITYRCLNDNDRTMLFLSDAVYKITGYTTDEILHSNRISYTELIHPKDVNTVKESVKNAIEEDQQFTLEYRIRTKNGGGKWVWEQGIGLKKPNGEVDTIEGHIIDISEQKAMEIALSESEEKFKKTFQSIPTAIILTTASTGTVIDANNSFMQMTGWSRNEFIGKTTKEIELWANMKDRDEYIETLTRKGNVTNKEYSFRRKSGEVRSGLVSGHILNLQTGKVVLASLSDITEQKQINQLLNYKHAHLQTLVQAIPDLIWLKDPNGAYLNCNSQFEKLIGTSETEIIGQTDYDFLDKELAESLRVNDLEAILAGKPLTIREWVTFTNDRHRTYLEIVKTPMYDNEHNLIGTLGIAHDITAHKRNEEALRKSEIWYKSIFANTGTATTIINADKVLILVNEQFEKLSGFSKSELENKMKWTDFVSKEDLERMQKFHQVRRKEDANVLKQYEFTFIDRQQKQHHILLTIDMITGTEMSVASLLDISPRINAINQLKESHEKYQNLVENINDIIYELDSEWRFKYVSPSVEAITGFKPEHYIGKSFIEVVAMEDVERVKARYDDFMETKKIQTIDFRVNNTKDHVVWIHISGRPIIEDGEIKGSRGIAMNITKQKEIEAQLIQAKEKAEKADRLKSAFLATMSHELRTPLNAIIGFSQLIDETLAKEEILKMTEIIHSSGNHLLSIIESIFEIAMLHSRQAKIRTSEFFFHDLVKSLKFYMNGELKKADKKFIASSFQEMTINDHFLLKTDQTKLTQLLTNLLNNAIKYSENGKIRFGYSVENNDITFHVEDEGIGISKEQQQIIFERFRQIDDSSTRKYGGVGLGLAICKEISDLLDGKLWVESEVGQGSTFYFQLHNVISNKK